MAVHASMQTVIGYEANTNADAMQIAYLPIHPTAVGESGFGLSNRSKAQSATAVDLALVLAVDCSSSVDVADFRIQMDGIAASFRNPPLFEAIAAGSYRRIAVTLVQWSSRDSQAIAIAWR